MKIAVRIERLVLDGLAVTPVEGQRVRRAVEAEIGRLLTAAGPPRLTVAGGAAPAVVAPPLQLSGDETPTALGMRIAGSVHNALRHPDQGGN
jgi:hypothetical protein